MWNDTQKPTKLLLYEHLYFYYYYYYGLNIITHTYMQCVCVFKYECFNQIPNNTKNMPALLLCYVPKLHVYCPNSVYTYTVLYKYGINSYWIALHEYLYSPFSNFRNIFSSIYKLIGYIQPFTVLSFHIPIWCMA